MFNTSTANVTYEIYEGDVLLYEGVAPYIMVPHLINSMNYTPYNIVFTQLGTRYAPQYSIDHYIAPPRAEHYTISVYNDLLTQKEMFERETLEATRAELAMLRAREDALVAEERYLQNLFEQSETMFRESLLAQEQLTLQHAQELEAEQYRLDMLRVQTVTQVATDPSTSIEALMSEVGENGDVQRQIAQVVSQNKDLALDIMNSNTTRWLNSFAIMDAITALASRHVDVRTTLLEKLPAGSALSHTLSLYD